MDLLLSKILSRFFVFPLGLGIGLGILAALMVWLGRRRLALSAGLLGVGILWTASTPAFSLLLRSPLETAYPPVRAEAAPVADAIVVLGGAVGPLDPTFGPDLKSAADRVLHGARLYRAGKANWVVAVGGTFDASGLLGPEADAMAALLKEWGVPDSAIVREGQSLNTRQNALRTKPILDALQAREVLLVTSALHMRRAVAAFRMAGIAVIPSATDFETLVRSASATDWLPDADALWGTTRAIKEYVGFLVYRMRGWA